MGVIETRTLYVFSVLRTNYICAAKVWSCLGICVNLVLIIQK